MLTCATERKALEDALKYDLEEDDEDDSAEALLNLQDDDGNIEFAISVWHVLIINHQKVMFGTKILSISRCLLRRYEF